MIITVTPNTSIDRSIEVAGFAVGETLKGRLLKRRPAGKGINVSHCLAALGITSIAPGFVGRRERPFFAEVLAEHNVIDRLVEVDGTTRCNTTYLDPEAGTETHIRELGFEVGALDLDKLRNTLARDVSAVDVVVISGSQPPGMSPDALAELIQTCRAGGARVVLDSSEPDASTAGLAVDLLTPNLDELSRMTTLRDHAPAAVIESARSLLDRVPQVVVTLGARGAVGVFDGQAWLAEGASGPTHHTVGCGDAFLAGYLAAEQRGEQLPDRLRLGVACGGASARRSIAGEIAASDVEDLLSQIKLERVS